jgi:hypothetical protein
MQVTVMLGNKITKQEEFDDLDAAIMFFNLWDHQYAIQEEYKKAVNQDLSIMSWSSDDLLYQFSVD